MYSKFWPKGGVPGVLHHFTETLVAFEYTNGIRPKPHSVIFIGGLGDGLATTSYLYDLVNALEPTKWSIFSPVLTSSYQSWGLGHLDRDTDEIAQCLEYIGDYKSQKYKNGKVVLMGHSTGSQDVLHYISRPNPHTSEPDFDPWLQHTERPTIDGAIMQAPVSDREAMFWVLENGIGGRTPSEVRKVFDALVAAAKSNLTESSSDTILPLSMTSQIGYPSNTPLSARRFLSLVSPDSPASPLEDDVFSSDLSDEELSKTFGKIAAEGLLRQKLLVLPSGADQSVPAWIDKEELLIRWRKAVDHGDRFQFWDADHSGSVPNASHALSNDDQGEPRKELCGRILAYLKGLDHDSVS